jgi:CRP-like cAMP-binding protein
LLPINSIRLFQMRRLVRRVEDAAQGDFALEELLPFMARRRFRRGAILFRKHDRGHEMFYLLRGEIHLPELGKTLRAGAVLGEISLFAPERRRIATAICATDGELLAMTADQVRALYFQNPKFGFHLVQLITRRLLENCARTEVLPGRWSDREGLHARAAA